MKTFFTQLFFVWSALLVGVSESSAQQGLPRRACLFSVFNAATQLPVGQFFSSPAHLGAMAGLEFRYNQRPKNQWFQTAKLGFSRHRYVQNSIQLYSEIGYRQAIWRGTAAELRLGGGYLHAIPATEVFALKNKAYEKKVNYGRPQAMVDAALALSYSPEKWTKPFRFSLDYQFYLQLPFVKQYITLLPNTLVHVGAAMPFSVFKNKKSLK